MYSEVFILLLLVALIGYLTLAYYLKRRSLACIQEALSNFSNGSYQDRINHNLILDPSIRKLSNNINSTFDTISNELKKLSEEDSKRREFIASISHDLRSPLTSINGFLETVIVGGDTLSNEERSEYLGIALKNTQHLTSLVEDLFELSKLETKLSLVKNETIIIEKVVEQVVQRYKPFAEKKDILLITTGTTVNSQVYGDARLLNRAISNLVQNAIYYTPRGGEVLIKVEKFNTSVSITVEDNGIGIAKEEIPYIFDRFYRVNKDRSKTTGGSGLGLAITKKILDLHESDITVTSVPKHGSSFSFDLASI